MSAENILELYQLSQEECEETEEEESSSPSSSFAKEVIRKARRILKEDNATLLSKVGALLRALKGRALQCGRDKAEIALAQAWVLKLPIVELPESVFNMSSLSLTHTSSSLTYENVSAEHVNKNNYSSSLTNKLAEVSLSPHTSYTSLPGATRPSVRHKANVLLHSTSTLASTPKSRITSTAQNLTEMLQNRKINKFDEYKARGSRRAEEIIHNSSAPNGTPRTLNWNTSSLSTEPIYPSLAFAFDAVVKRLYDWLISATKEWNVNFGVNNLSTFTLPFTTSNNNNNNNISNNDEEDVSKHVLINATKTAKLMMRSRENSHGSILSQQNEVIKERYSSQQEEQEQEEEHLATEQFKLPSLISSLSHEELYNINGNYKGSINKNDSYNYKARQSLQEAQCISSREKKELMAFIVKLVTLFDCFIAHSEMPQEHTTNTLSLRGMSIIEPLPLNCLCSRQSASLLLSLACVLLQLSNNRVWEEQNTIVAIQSFIHNANVNVLESMLPRSTPNTAILRKRYTNSNSNSNSNANDTSRKRSVTERTIRATSNRSTANQHVAECSFSTFTETKSNLSVSRITPRTWETNSVKSSNESNDKSKEYNSSTLNSAKSINTENSNKDARMLHHCRLEEKEESEEQINLYEKSNSSLRHKPQLRLSTHLLQSQAKTESATLLQKNYENVHNGNYKELHTQETDPTVKPRLRIPTLAISSILNAHSCENGNNTDKCNQVNTLEHEQQERLYKNNYDYYGNNNSNKVVTHTSVLSEGDYSMNMSCSHSYASQEDRSISASNRFTSISTTPRSIGRTPRTFRTSAISAPIVRPYLGFRVNVFRDVTAASESPSSSSSHPASTLKKRGSTQLNNNNNNNNGDEQHESLSQTHLSRPTIVITEVASTYVNESGEQTTAPAAAAGMQAGDELVRFAGYAVTDLPAFNTIVSRHVRPNATLLIILRRNGEEIRTSIHVGSRKSLKK